MAFGRKKPLCRETPHPMALELTHGNGPGPRQKFGGALPEAIPVYEKLAGFFAPTAVGDQFWQVLDPTPLDGRRGHDPGPWRV